MSLLLCMSSHLSLICKFYHIHYPHQKLNQNIINNDNNIFNFLIYIKKIDKIIKKQIRSFKLIILSEMKATTDFKTQLANTIEELTLNEQSWGSEKWKSIQPLISQSTLNNAFENHNLILSIFPKFDDIITRKCKSIERVQKKMTEQIQNKENYFKVISDFLAVRIHCEVNEIKNKIDYIKEIVNLHNGYFHIRGSSEERPYGFFLSDSKYTDIVQYMYVYLKEIGYVIEFQIGHEFASYTFTINSTLRDNPKCGLINLWSEDFYDDVKKFILNKTNNIEGNIIMSDILIKANKIHQNNILNKVPNDLLVILNRL